MAMEMDGTPGVHAGLLPATSNATLEEPSTVGGGTWGEGDGCLLYTSDAADE